MTWNSQRKDGDNKGELMKKLEMWTEKCDCGTILHQMNAPCFECRKSSPERSKREDHAIDYEKEIKELKDFHNSIPWMRYSEHCGNTVREVQ